MMPNGTLHFTWVSGPRSEQADEGIYQCRASSPGVGTIVSTRARLSIVGECHSSHPPQCQPLVGQQSGSLYQESVNTNFGSVAEGSREVHIGS